MPGQAPSSTETGAPIPVSGDVNTPDAVPVAPVADTPVTASKALPTDINQRDLPLTQPAYIPVSPLAEAVEQTPTLPTDNRPEWMKVGYENLVKMAPDWSPARYAHETAKWRRDNGQPDMSYEELATLFKGRDPYETEKERRSRVRRERGAIIAQGLGSVLGNLINYARAKNGHVAMRLEDGSQGYNRLQRLREAQQQTARINANAYLDAMGRDRAERAKAEQRAAAAAAAQRDYEMKEAELRIKIDNAATQEARRAAEAELKKLQFEHKKKYDELDLQEKKRHNKQMEANARNGRQSEKYIELATSKGSRRYTPDKDGSNWIHKAYQDMLKEPGGDKYKVSKMSGLLNSSAPTDAEMYEAITRWNSDSWKDQYKSDRYKGGSEPPPLE